MYLPYAVRRAHRSAVEARLYDSRAFSSDSVYAGKSRLGWLTTTVLGALHQRGNGGSAGYHEFMDKRESEHVVQLRTRGSKWDQRVVGDQAFVSESTWRAAHVRPVPTKEEVIHAVARLIELPPALIYDRTPEAVLGRALVAS